MWAAGSPASLSLLSLPINTGPFVSGLIVPLPSQSPFCALLPAQRLCVQGAFLQLLFVPGCLLCLLRSVFVWGRGGGAPVCVGFINLVQSSKEMLSKGGVVNINPSVPCVTEGRRTGPRFPRCAKNVLGCL